MNFLRMLALTGAGTLLFAADPAPKSGIDASNFDTACKPCDDFWRYANGGWIDKNPIPARYSSWGGMSVMREGNQERLRVILEGAAAAKAAAGSNEQKIGDLYASCMDVEGIEKLGVKPVAGRLAKIAKVSTREELKALLLEMQAEGGRGGVVGVMAREDAKNSSEVVAYVMAGGLSLPEREFYFREDERTKKIRAEFTAHVVRLMKLAGIDKPKAGEEILAFEKKTAEAFRTIVERRDPYSSYNRKDLAGLAELAPAYDWKKMLAVLEIPAATPLIVPEVKALGQFSKSLEEAPLETWKTWLEWRTLTAAADMLPKAFVDEDFYFSSTVLNGVKEQLPRWQRCTTIVDRSLGDALGAAYVAKHFPPKAKQRMNELVENLRVTLREELSRLDWMTPETRANAVAKLNTFYPKVGYADRWRDYSDVKIARGALLENVRAASIASRKYNLAKIGKPVDRNDWGMTPPTVNAYYSAVKNEIAFPAGILQPPMFDMEADDAVNYGAIGAVIGHEMGHGFDDQGSKFDAQGNLKNWWTDEDRKKFEARAGCVIEQFNTMDVGEGLRHNGKLVVGEAIGDLGGLSLAYKAYKRSLGGKPGPVLDGYTADQRFFLAFARVWGTHMRPEAMRMRLATDPHPLSKFRANGTLMNMPEFHAAFGCKTGDAMVKPAAEQCRLW
jgi:putative endopeptidase